MAHEQSRDRGNLFENKDKKKPSQPDFQGDCTIDGVAYEIRGWHREEQLMLALAEPRGDRNTYPPDTFKGALDAVPAKPVPRNPKGGKGGKAGKAKEADDDAPPTPAWTGLIASEDATYRLSAFEKQGKSGPYFTLRFEQAEHGAQEATGADDEEPDPTAHEPA